MSTSSKLEGSHYGECPICKVDSDIGDHIKGLKSRIDEAYKIISDRNEMIADLQQRLRDLRDKAEKITNTNLKEH